METLNPFSLPVLGGAVVVSAPALWSTLTGQARLDVGLSRYLVAVLLCWLALTVVAGLVGPVPSAARTPVDVGEGEGAEPGRGDVEEQAAHGR